MISHGKYDQNDPRSAPFRDADPVNYVNSGCTHGAQYSVGEPEAAVGNAPQVVGMAPLPAVGSGKLRKVMKMVGMGSNDYLEKVLAGEVYIVVGETGNGGVWLESVANAAGAPQRYHARLDTGGNFKISREESAVFTGNATSVTLYDGPDNSTTTPLGFVSVYREANGTHSMRVLGRTTGGSTPGMFHGLQIDKYGSVLQTKPYMGRYVGLAHTYTFPPNTVPQSEPIQLELLAGTETGQFDLEPDNYTLRCISAVPGFVLGFYVVFDELAGGVVPGDVSVAVESDIGTEGIISYRRIPGVYMKNLSGTPPPGENLWVCHGSVRFEGAVPGKIVKLSLILQPKGVTTSLDMITVHPFIARVDLDVE